MLGLERVDSTGTQTNLCVCIRACVCVCTFLSEYLEIPSISTCSTQRVKVSLLSVCMSEHMHIHKIQCVCMVTCLWWIEKFRFRLTLHWLVCIQWRALSDKLMHHHRAASVCLPLMSPVPNVYRASPLFPLPVLCKKTSLKWRLYRMLHFISKLPHWSQNFWAKVHLWSQASLGSLWKHKGLDKLALMTK